MAEILGGLAAHITEHCDLMIEESLAALDSSRWDEMDDYEASYNDGYHQGRKDACRVILLVVKDHA